MGVPLCTEGDLGVSGCWAQGGPQVLTGGAPAHLSSWVSSSRSPALAFLSILANCWDTGHLPQEGPEVRVRGGG